MERIPATSIIPSAAFTISRRNISHYQPSKKRPVFGDLIYGEVTYLGKHVRLENKFGRIHKISTGTKAIFIFGSRYAPHVYEGIVPKTMVTEVDLLARSGVVGLLQSRNASMADPTRIKILGYACSSNGNILNTRDFCKINHATGTKSKNRAKMILVVGTSMNSGKTSCAAACCWALSSAGYNVRAAKLTGVATLKDILHMQDAGASIVKDFTSFGYPSTYLLSKKELLHIFNSLDLKNANNRHNYWVVEIGDGILQKEAAILLNSKDVTSRIHRLIFTAHDPLGVIGGIKVLKEKYGLTPDGISGIFSGAPLFFHELSEYTDIPILNSKCWDQKQLLAVLESKADSSTEDSVVNSVSSYQEGEMGT